MHEECALASQPPRSLADNWLIKRLISRSLSSSQRQKRDTQRFYCMSRKCTPRFKSIYTPISRTLQFLFFNNSREDARVLISRQLVFILSLHSAWLYCMCNMCTMYVGVFLCFYTGCSFKTLCCFGVVSNQSSLNYFIVLSKLIENNENIIVS